MSTVFLLRRTRHALLKAAQALEGSSWHCVGASERVDEAAEQICQLRPDVLACDLRLLDGHAGRLLNRLGGVPPRTLLLTPTVNDPLLFESLRGGAHGFWLDQGCSESLLEALQAHQDGRADMSPDLARQTLQAFGLPRSELKLAHCVAAAQEPRTTGVERLALNQAQQHLLSLIAHGLLASEIAQRWQLTLDEVGQRLAGIYAALHALYTPQPVSPALAPA